MRVSLLYGQGTVQLDMPDRVRVLEMDPLPGLEQPERAVAESLQRPIRSSPLGDLAAGRRSACVVISDITRPVPNRTLLGPILGTLEQSGIQREDITILVATGMHRPNLGDELVSMVGRDIAERYRIENHSCRKQEDLRRVTEIEGTPVEVNTHYLDADLKILTGLIEPHFYAGYSGGRKSLLPGISSFETMKLMHSYRMIDHPRVTNCLLDGNPFHEYGLRVCELAGADFIVNVVINRDREIAGVFAGHYDAAHRRGSDLVAEHCVREVPQRQDMVITSGGGYPLDATLYQISKGLTCAKDILKPGGTIVVACECREGLGSREFCEIMQSCAPEDFFSHYCEPHNFAIDQWCAQNIYQAIDHAGAVYICSEGLSAADLQRAGAIKCDHLQGTLDRLWDEHERITAVPAGPYVVGKVPEGTG
jgi:nickel-dependent lactate racemase